MNANPSPSTTLAAEPDHISWVAYLGLGLAAAVLGVVTSIGVWLFNQAFNAIHNLTFNTIGGALQPIGAWTIALIPAVGGILVALIMKLGTKPDKLAAMAHIIDGVTEHGGRLNVPNGVTFIIASALGIGVGAPVGADTPSAMIGGHLASWFGQRFHQRELFIRALVVAGVGAGISATFFAQFAAIFFAFEVVLGGFGGGVFVAPTLIAIAMSAMVNFWLNGAATQYTTQVVVNHWNLTLLLYLGAALLIGSALGYAYGDIVVQLFPGLQLNPIAFAMVTTAAMLAGTFHAPLFGAMMVLEMTSNYGLLVPVLFGAALAYALARRFQPGSAYTFALPGAGIRLRPGTFTIEKPGGE